MEIAWNDFRERQLAAEIERMASDSARRKAEAEDRRVIELCRLEKQRNATHRTVYNANVKPTG